jgi:hypothetical protein
MGNVCTLSKADKNTWQEEIGVRHRLLSLIRRNGKETLVDYATVQLYVEAEQLSARKDRNYFPWWSLLLAVTNERLLFFERASKAGRLVERISIALPLLVDVCIFSAPRNLCQLSVLSDNIVAVDKSNSSTSSSSSPDIYLLHVANAKNLMQSVQKLVKLIAKVQRGSQLKLNPVGSENDHSHNASGAGGVLGSLPSPNADDRPSARTKSGTMIASATSTGARTAQSIDLSLSSSSSSSSPANVGDLNSSSSSSSSIGAMVSKKLVRLGSASKSFRSSTSSPDLMLAADDAPSSSSGKSKRLSLRGSDRVKKSKSREVDTPPSTVPAPVADDDGVVGGVQVSAKLRAQLSVLAQVWAELDAMGFHENELFDGDTDLASLVYTLRLRHLVPSIPATEAFLLEVMFPQDRGEFGGLQRQVYKIECGALVRDVTARVCARVCQRNKVFADMGYGSDEFVARYGLRSRAGLHLDDDSALSQYGLGCIFLHWQVWVYAKPVRQSETWADYGLVEFYLPPPEEDVDGKFHGQKRSMMKVNVDLPVPEIVGKLCAKLRVDDASAYGLYTLSSLPLPTRSTLRRHGLKSLYAKLQLQVVPIDPYGAARAERQRQTDAEAQKAEAARAARELAVAKEREAAEAGAEAERLRAELEAERQAIAKVARQAQVEQDLAQEVVSLMSHMELQHHKDQLESDRALDEARKQAELAERQAAELRRQVDEARAAAAEAEQHVSKAAKERERERADALAQRQREREEAELAIANAKREAEEHVAQAAAAAAAAAEQPSSSTSAVRPPLEQACAELVYAFADAAVDSCAERTSLLRQFASLDADNRHQVVQLVRYLESLQRAEAPPPPPAPGSQASAPRAPRIPEPPKDMAPAAAAFIRMQRSGDQFTRALAETRARLRKVSEAPIRSRASSRAAASSSSSDAEPSNASFFYGALLKRFSSLHINDPDNIQSLSTTNDSDDDW